MSEETIINRTPETAGLAHERQKLEAETIQGNEKLLNPPGRTVGYAQTAEAARTGQVGKIEEVKAPEFVEGLSETKVDLQAKLEQLIKESKWQSEASVIVPRDPDLKKFKEQVIAAFKHLGLDTAKFFS